MRIIYFMGLSVLSFSCKAQDYPLFEKHQYIQANDTMPYRLLMPLDFDNTKNYPLILFLHGSGERGNDNKNQLTHGATLFLKDSVRKNFPAIVVFPQCAANSYWSNTIFKLDSVSQKRTFEFIDGGKPTKAMILLLGLVKNLQDTYLLEDNQLYVGGLSMGGMGTFELVNRLPKTFAAAFAICGGANPVTAKNSTGTAWWIFHGEKDNVVNPQFSKEMAKALKVAGADVQLTLYPEAGHNSWDQAFQEPGLLPWLFSNRK